MKLHGQTVKSVNLEYAVIPRPASYEPKLDDTGAPITDDSGAPVLVEKNNDFIFIARAVSDYSEFEKLYPAPKPPKTKKVGGEEFENTKDPIYLSKLATLHAARVNWIVLESLKATPELEWETVKADDSSTWGNYSKELEDSGFSWREIGMIQDAVFKANALNDDKIQEARKRFLAGLGKAQ